MVWGRIRDAIAGAPTLEGPSKVPDYFPVEPRGCEVHSQRLFECLTNEATAKAREIERVKSNPPSDGKDVSADASSSSPPGPPSVGDNPLDECRSFIAYYKRCCDRELKKKHNWMLTEPYRVQEEYRYNKQDLESEQAAGASK